MDENKEKISTNKTRMSSGNNVRRRHKICEFCFSKVKIIDFKDSVKLKKYLTDRAKIVPRRMTGTCSKHQRQLTVAIKRARHMALLPYTAQ